MQSRHSDLSNTNGGEASVEDLCLRDGRYAERDQLRDGSVVSISYSKRGIPIRSPSIELLPPPSKMVRYRPLDGRIVQIERGVSFDIPEVSVDIWPLEQKLGSRNVAVIQRAVQRRPMALRVDHVDVYGGMREKQADKLRGGRILGRGGEVEDGPSEVVSRVDVNGRRGA